MATFIILLWVGIAFSVHCGLFLPVYYKLVKANKKTKGVIVSFDRGSFILLRDILVPIVRFKTGDNSVAEGVPEHSYFMNLNDFGRQSDVTVYYEANNPESFVIESRTEVAVNWLIIAVTLCSLAWLFLY